MAVKALDTVSFHQAINDIEDVLIVDTRAADEFAEGFIPGALSLPLFEILPDQLEGWTDIQENALLVCHPNQLKDSIEYLQKLGITNIQGWLHEGMEAWQRQGMPVDLIIAIDPDELAMDIPYDDSLVMIDVRSLTEYAEGHIKDAAHMPLSDFADLAEVAALPESVNAYIYCSNGIRSTLAASLLKRHGYQNLRVVMALWDTIASTKGITAQKDATLLN